MKWTLETVNERLKAGKIGVTVRQRGDRLSLRATLPPKPNSGKQIWHQQDISLKIYANPAGFQRAEAEAKLLGGRIASGEFSWTFYIDVEEEEFQSPLKAEEWVKKFEEDYFARRGRSPTTERTWKSDYVPAWNLLGEKDLSQENLIAAMNQLGINTQKRRRVCEKLSALARFAGLNVNLLPYAGNYSYGANLSSRYIPSTEEIESARLLFCRPDWQWIFGVLAVYGLRPHEAFFCEISQKTPYLLKVLKGKTGYREVYPYHLRWVEAWQLTEQLVPPCNGLTLREYGHRVTQIFNRKKVKFSPYCLRHAFCIRLATEYKIPVPIAARWTGHDPAIFLRVYNRWISEGEMRRVFEESQKNS